MQTGVIVVGSDLAETSDAALAYALGLAPRLDARVVLVHVLEGAELPSRRSAPVTQIAAFRKVIDWQHASAEQRLARQIRRVSGRKGQVVIEVRSGKPAVQLLIAASKRRAILLVLGMTGQPGGPGHVVQRVLAATRMPVLVVPSTPREPVRTTLSANFRLPPPARARRRARAG